MSESNRKFTIIDYGVGNLESALRAFQKFTPHVVITDDKSIIQSSDALILPGVGSYKSGMDGLRVRGLVETVKIFAKSGRPMLGICLGAQIMLSEGHEFGVSAGLNIVGGVVEKFPELEANEKIPHMGWNTIAPLENNGWDGTIMAQVPENSSVYFVHSFILNPQDKKEILTITHYGGYEFCSAFRTGKIYGCQFHPEKSGEVGLQIIQNFIHLTEKL